jgi:transketolase
MLEPVLAATAHRDVTVAYIATVQPLDAGTLGAMAHGASDVVTVEPYLAGTSAPTITAALSDRPRRFLFIGAPREEIRRYGTLSELESAVGLDAFGIAARLDAFLTSEAA